MPVAGPAHVAGPARAAWPVPQAPAVPVRPADIDSPDDGSTVPDLPDLDPPEVTINQGAGQADPTDTLPIVFDLVVSEPVVGLEADSILVVTTGSCGSPTAFLSPTSSPLAYTVAIVGLDGDCWVRPLVRTATFTDLDGNENASSSTFDDSVAYIAPASTATAPAPVAPSAPDEPGEADPSDTLALTGPAELLPTALVAFVLVLVGAAAVVGPFLRRRPPLLLRRKGDRRHAGGRRTTASARPRKAAVGSL